MGEENNLPEQEPASPQEQVSEGGEPKTPEPAEPQQPSFTPEQEARIEQKIAEATQRAIEQGKELGKREMQGIKDREVAQEKRRAEEANSRLQAFQNSLSGLDEDTKAQIDQRTLKAENQYFRQREQTEEARRQQEAYFTSLENLKQEHLKSYGIDPTDKRIDWGDKTDDFISGWTKFNASVNKIVQENQASLQKKYVDDAEERFKKLESDFRKEHGLDSVPPSTGTGIETGDAKFVEQMTAGDLPLTKANIDRFNKIQGIT